MRVYFEKILQIFKQIGIIILNNKFLPINLLEHNGYHKTAILFLVGIIMALIALTPYDGDVTDIVNSPLIPDEISEKEFDERNLNVWINLAAYKRYNDNKRLKRKLKLPNPKYPRIRRVFESIYGEYIEVPFGGENVKMYMDQLFPPINIIEINKVLRRTIGSGIKIKTDDEILYEVDLTEKTKEEQIEELNKLKNEYWTISSIVLKGGEENKETYKVHIDYNTIGKKITDNRVPEEIRVAYNESRFIPQKIDVERYEYEVLKKTFELDNSGSKEREFLRDLYKIDNDKKYYELKETVSELDSDTRTQLRTILNKIKFNPIVDFKNVYERESFPKTQINKAVVYKNESKVLRHKPNSRIYVDDKEIPNYIKRAFVVVEDDFFYVNIGGIDPPGLVRATINYIIVGAEKGNASITEQMYEMYLGKQRKKLEDKFVQILFAIYYAYYSKDREEILNFYIQSIPGSFWGDHCYGIKSIAQNYLGKSDLKSLTWKELAWMTRIALLPSVHGIEYARFNLMKDIFEERDYEIFLLDNEGNYVLDEKGNRMLNDDEVDRFLLLKSNIESIRFPGDKVKNAKDMKRLIERYKRSYDITTKRVNLALLDFKNGNNFITPLITEKEYEKALNEDIKFVKPDFTNLYQVYTDQTRKDINRIFGKWAWNAGFTVTVSLDEAVQTLIDRELEYSTIVAPYFKYWSADDAPQLGGGAIMVKTHSIEDPMDIQNKILALGSKHPEETYFNWAVDGYRHFGSIYKWLVLLLYLDQEGIGTLLDQYYDIPREFIIYEEDEDEKDEELIDNSKRGKYYNKKARAKALKEEEEENEKRRTMQNLYDIDEYYGSIQEVIFNEKEDNQTKYRPDNWKRNPREDIFGYYTYKRENNITNFIQSKNVTFVHLSWITGIEKVAKFLNEASGIDPETAELRRIYQPFLSTVLGTGESSSVTFAQATSLISNKGKWKPLSTIEKIVEFDNTEINIEEEPIQLVSREAAEQAFYVGYINTFMGTAKRFIKKGIGKTGTADTDVSFLAMTGRDKTQYIEEAPEHILNSNLLYLVNVGVNSGKLPDGLWGGLNGAYNARDTFRTILGWNGKEGKNEKYKYDISGEFWNSFSDDFDYKKHTIHHWSGEYHFNVPIPEDKDIHYEKTISPSKIQDTRFAYEDHAKIKYMNEQFDSVAEGFISDLNPIDMNTISYVMENEKYEDYFPDYEKYRYTWMQDPNIRYNSITGDFIDKRTGKKVGNSLDYLREDTIFDRTKSKNKQNAGNLLDNNTDESESEKTDSDEEETEDEEEKTSTESIDTATDDDDNKEENLSLSSSN